MKLLGTHRSLELAVLRLWGAGYQAVPFGRCVVWHQRHNPDLPPVVRARVVGKAIPYRTVVEAAPDVHPESLPGQPMTEAA